MKFLTLSLCLSVVLAAPKSTNLKFRNLYKTPIQDARPNPSGRIVNGEVAEPNSIPFQAFLEVYDSTGGWYCGGSLISPTVILTAGHCVYEAQEAYITLGAHRLSEAEDSQVYIHSTDFVLHDNFDMDLILYDIGLIILPEPVEINENIALVLLPNTADTDNTYEGIIGTVSGWGLTVGGTEAVSDVLLYIQNPIISNNECSEVFGNIPDYQVCMSGEGGRAVCDGDSGGPLFVDGVQIGVVSYGAPYCNGNYPSGFTRTTSFLDWIEQHSR